MAKRKSRSSSSASGVPRALVVIAILAVLAFAIGEAWFLLRSDAGRLTLGRLGFGDTARITRIVGRNARRGLEAVGIARDSIRESVADTGAVAVRWRVGLRPGASLLQANYALTEAMRTSGATVLSGRESRGPKGESVVTLVLGLGGRPTHRVTLVRAAVEPQDSEKRVGKVAFVLYGFGDDTKAALALFEEPAPFAVAIVPGAKNTAELLHAAHARQREVLVHVPLEPLNYPRINPGPGTLLVTLSPSQVAARVKKWIEQASPVVAVSNHMGSLATQDMQVMTSVYKEVRRANLPFIHVQPAPGSVCKALASELGVAYGEPDELLDPDVKPEQAKTLEKRWKALLEEARDRGQITVWVRASPRAGAWLERAADPKRLGGVSLVPLSSVIRRPVSL